MRPWVSCSPGLGSGSWSRSTRPGGPLAVFALAPDVTMLLGSRPGLQRGQLDPRAVPAYNAVHRYWAPIVLVVVAFVLNSTPWVAAGLAWCAHISFDRSLGFGLRTAQGFQRERAS